jgi:hypothetical protein
MACTLHRSESPHPWQAPQGAGRRLAGVGSVGLASNRLPREDEVASVTVVIRATEVPLATDDA